MSKQYQEARNYLLQKGVDCCGYVTHGKKMTIYNSLCQITVYTRSAIKPQIDYYLRLYK